jgi:hypothetical protein
MPDPTNVEQIQEEKAQESLAAYKLAAVRTALMTLDPTYAGVSLDYLALVDRLRTVLDAELARLTAPPKETR